MKWAEWVARTHCCPFNDVVIGSAEQTVLSESKFVPRDKLSAAGHTSKTFDMVHLGAGSHHKVVLAETDVAFSAFYPV